MWRHRHGMRKGGFYGCVIRRKLIVHRNCEILRRNQGVLRDGGARRRVPRTLLALEEPPSGKVNTRQHEKTKRNTCCGSRAHCGPSPGRPGSTCCRALRSTGPASRLRRPSSRPFSEAGRGPRGTASSMRRRCAPRYASQSATTGAGSGWHTTRGAAHPRWVSRGSREDERGEEGGAVY